MGFNDDYYWTGGGFSDWSGRSAGKFSSGSSSGGSSGGGGYQGSSQNGSDLKEALLNEERKIGLPASAISLPRFMNSAEWAKKVFQLLVIVGLEVFASYMYIERPCGEYLGWSLPVYVVANFMLFAFVIDTTDWYPGLSNELTFRGVRDFYKWIKVVQVACSVMGIVFALTPLVYSISEHEVPNGWAIAVIVVDLFFSGLLLYASIMGTGVRDMVRDRTPYLFYKAGILDREQQKMVREIGEKQTLLLKLCREKKSDAETKGLVEEINKMKVTFLNNIKN